MRDNLEDVVAPHGPAKVQDGPTRAGVMNLLSVSQDQAFSRRDAPHESDVVFLTTTCRSGLSVCKSFLVGKAEPPVVDDEEIVVIVVIAIMLGVGR